MVERAKNRFSGRGLRAVSLAGILLALLGVWAGFHARINRALVTELFLRADSPSEDTFLDLTSQSPDPPGFLRRCWNTGKIPHREMVAAYLKNIAASNPPWFAKVEQLMLAGALDPDVSVRELALATLDWRRDPRLFDLARAQLADLDPMVRQLGLQYLQNADATRGVPAVMPLLDDPELQVVTRAEAALMRWTGQDFGVRVRLALHQQDSPAGSTEARADEQKIREGVARRKQWWAEHAREFATDPPVAAAEPLALQSVRDFSLPSVSGARVRLTSFRGRVVVLNFWATWCTACLAEIPDLAALHQKSGDRIGVLGVALDGLPDDHYHHNEARAAEEHSVGKSMAEINKKVLRAVAARGINYPVLLDPTGSVGGRFNGGELPTTVIIDRAGYLRRRFIGERSLPVFEAMVAEAAQPRK